MVWPKDEEQEQINQFIEDIKKARNILLSIYSRYSNKSKYAGPDYVLQVDDIGKFIGVELTSDYLNNISVPSEHKSSDTAKPTGAVFLHSSPSHLNRYKQRLIDTIKGKVEKSKNYDLGPPIILAIYSNEYITIAGKQSEWTQLLKEVQSAVGSCEPFREVILFNDPLMNGRIYSLMQWDGQVL